MKHLRLILLVTAAAVFISACGTAGTTTSWPGLAADTDRVYLADGQFVYGLRLSDGSKVWQYPEKAGSQLFYSAPVLTPDGQLLVGSAGSDNSLVSLDPATGQTKWAAPFVASNHWVAPPLVVKDTIYAANNSGTLYALGLSTGQELWSLPLGRSLWGAPASNGTLVFVTSLDHFLYAVDPQKQALAWKVDLGGSAPGTVSVGSDGSTVYVGSFGKKVLGIDAASGAVRWTADVKDWVWGAPVVGSDSVFAADIAGNVYSFGAPNGKNAWPAIQPDGPITGSPLVLPNGMLVATESGSVVAYDPTGTKLWDATVGGKIYATPVASGDRIAVAPTGADFLLAVLDQNGKLLWKFTGK
jgi:eukaryotic-like serine/threonine-protein kinase